MRTNRDSTLPDEGLGDPDVAPAALLTAGEILTLAERLADTLRTAEAFVAGRRRVDLRGLDQQVQDMCKRALDLPHGEASILLPKLHGLMARIDSLLATLAASSDAER